MAQQSRALASRFEKMFVTYNKSLNFKYSYRTVRGFSDEEVLTAVDGVDLLILSGSMRTAEHWEKISEQKSIAVLNVNDSAHWPKEIIGFCLNPKQSLDTVRWTITLGKMLKRKVRLFWNGDFDIDEEWISNLNKDRVTESISRTKIKDISVVQPIFRLEILRHFRNSLFVVPRKELNNELELEFSRHLPIAILLI
jgi:hypothetical protein